MAVSQRRLVDRTDRLRAAGAPGRPDGGPAQRRNSGLAQRRTRSRWRMDTVRFSGREHLGDGPGGVVAAGDGWRREARARRGMAPRPLRDGDFTGLPSERVSPLWQAAGGPGSERLAVVSGNGDLGDADVSRHFGVEQVLLAAAFRRSAGAHRPGPELSACAPVRRWRMESRLGVVAGVQLGFLSGDDGTGFVGAGGHGSGEAAGEL